MAEHVVEMSDLPSGPRVPKAPMGTRHGSQDIPLLNEPVCVL